MLRTIRSLLVFFAWFIAAFAFLFMPPMVATVWLAAIGGAFIWRYAMRGSRSGRRMRALLRVRRPGPEVKWVALAAPIVPLWSASLLLLTFRVTSYPVGDEFEIIAKYAERPLGWWPLGLLLVGVGPLMEEFTFRGWIQRPFERGYGPAWGIALAATLFSLAHLQPWGLLDRFFLGAILGFAVYATRSIWSGFLLHASNNLAAVLAGGALDNEAQMKQTIASTQGLVVAMVTLILTTAALVWLGRQLWRDRSSVRTSEVSPRPRSDSEQVTPSSIME